MTQCTKCSRPSADYLCWDCTRSLSAALEQIPWLADELTVTWLRGDRLGDTDGGRAHHAPLPFNDTARQFATALHGLVVGCAQELAEARQLPLDWITQDPTTGVIADWLRHHVTDLRQLDTAGDTHVQIAQAVDRGLAIINRPVPLVYRGPCPQPKCGLPLYGPRGEPFVTCTGCHTRHDTARLEQRHLADLGNTVFRVTHLLAVMRELGEPVSAGGFYEWRDKGKVKPAAWERPDGTVTRHWIHRGDVALYRLVDVRRVRADSALGQAG